MENFVLSRWGWERPRKWTRTTIQIHWQGSYGSVVVGVVMSQAEVVVVVLNFGMAEVLRVMEPKMRRESWLISI